MHMLQNNLIKPNVFTKIALTAIISTSLIGCVTSPNNQLLERGSAQTQLQKRSYQSRAFDTTDKNKSLRSIIASLQDLGFIIDKADSTLGTVSATKFVNNTALKMTVSTRQRGQSQIQVRANAQYGLKPIEDPNSYQDFFTTLSKAMFLEAQEVNEG